MLSEIMTGSQQCRSINQSKITSIDCQLQQLRITFGIRIAVKFEARYRSLVMHEIVRETEIDVTDVINVV